jgi:DNA-binding GntR family transcriptional regulator
MPKTSVRGRSDLVDRITQDIQSGVFGSGAWLKQIDLQRHYEANRLEVRRALEQLTLKRLIEHVPNRGYHVHINDPRRYKEIIDVRVLLEVGAAAEVIANATAVNVRRLRDEAERFSTLLLQGTALQQYEANLAFHYAMYDMCANRELVALIQDFRERAPAAVTVEWVTRARIEQSAKEHFALIDAIEAKDLPRFQMLLGEHIDQRS